jgi:hypothetical protein
MSPSVRPSTAPAGVPPAGNGKYIAILVVLVGGIGALLAYRQCGSKDNGPPKPLALIDAAPTPHDNPDDKLPPPPPVEEPVDAAPPPRQLAAGPGPDLCSAKSCSGSATPDLEGALAFRAKQAHRCYDMALAQDSTLKGKMGITVRVASNGQVCRADVASNELGSAQVGQCVANMFRQSGHFPPPKGGCVEATVPINFVPGGK